MRNSHPAGSSAFGAPVGIHFFYVVLILSLALVLTMTTQWTELPKFTDYLTAAGTITSLVLGVLAIIYSFVSSRQQGDLMVTFEVSGRAIENAASELKALSTSGTEIQRRGEERIGQMFELVGQLRQTLGQVHEKQAELSNSNSVVLQKIGALQSALTEQSSIPVPAEEADASPADTKQMLKDSLQQSSIFGLIVCWLMVEGKGSTQKISLEKYCNAAGIPDSEDYFRGFLVAWSCTRFFTATGEQVEDMPHKVFSVESIHPDLAALLANEWNRRVASADASNKEFLNRLRQHVSSSLV